MIWLRHHFNCWHPVHTLALFDVFSKSMIESMKINLQNKVINLVLQHEVRMSEGCTSNPLCLPVKVLTSLPSQN